MSFFNLSDGKNAAEGDGTFDSGASMEPMPDNTELLAMIDEAKWDSYEGDSYISLRWSVMAPEEYKNRKVFQKVRVFETDSAKADKAKRMLGAIDKNAGGKLAASGAEPTDESMTGALCHKPMMVKVRVWEMNDKSGNFISSVAPRTAGVAATPVQSAPTAGSSDDIPF